MDETSCPNPLSKADASKLIGVLADLEGLIAIERIGIDEVQRIGRRVLESDSTQSITPENVRAALGALTQRIRVVLDEV